MKKLLGIIVLSLLLSGSAYADEFDKSEEYLENNFEWGYPYSNPYKITLEITNPSSNNDRLYTKFRIFLNCKTNGTQNENMELQETIDFKDIILRPYEIKRIDIASKFEKKDNQCGELVYKKSSWVSLLPQDPCINEKNFISKSLCKAKNKEWNSFKSDKISRGEAADNCSRKSSMKPKEVRSQYYKDCMKDEGY
jgi:hypothetical protein